MCSQPTQLATTRRNARDANGNYTLRVWRVPLGDKTASLNAATPFPKARKRLSAWIDEAAIRDVSWRDAHVALTGKHDVEFVRKPTQVATARESGLIGDTKCEAHAAEVRQKRLFVSKPGKLAKLNSKTALQLRVEYVRKVERAATKRASAIITLGTSDGGPK